MSLLSKFSVGLFLIASGFSAAAQDSYKYAIDLTQPVSDELKVELLTPTVTSKEIVFHMPKIVPGTYMNSDFGQFVHNIQAFDKAGKSLAVKALADSNSWSISKAASLYKITYSVEDSWDSKLKHHVYEMAGTNFEAGKNFVLNTCGIFGFLEGFKKIPFELHFTKPSNLFASTALIPVNTTPTTDVFRCANVDNLYDSPIMFCVPDTTTIKVGVTDVLISVYSPKKKITSKGVANNLQGLLNAAKNYLGGKLPVNRYAFLYYFNSEQPTVMGQGAWEHSYSSFYALPEGQEKNTMPLIVDVSSHEFFHIITPLNICSKEVREFNFSETVLSKHLWLYEGSTEYDAHHTQVTQGLITPDDYLSRLSGNIFVSRKRYNDTLPFTELSLGSADQHADQYGNVYQKGALISACLDLYLLKLSGGHYSLNNLKHDLSVRYGPENYFNDNDLFDEITKLTYPEVRRFFSDYVEGSKALPYEYFFGLAGVNYVPKRDITGINLGGYMSAKNGDGNMIVRNMSKMNEFGKKMGYKTNDELVSLNGKALTSDNYLQTVDAFLATAKEGDLITMVVKRKDTDGSIKTVTLSAPAMNTTKTEEHKLSFGTATPEQLALRNVWLNIPCGK